MRFCHLQSREVVATPSPDQRRELLVAAARACRAWTEIDRSELVERERGYVVRAATDECFRRYRGDAFSPSGTIVADQTRLSFYVDESGGLHMLEPESRPWSEIVYERERRLRAVR